MFDTRVESRVIARLIGEDYNRLVRALEPGDLWGQVRRHAAGQPIDEAQIALMVGAIHNALALQPKDVLLDLGCGNGALSARLAPFCAELIGVDVARALIEVAERRFGSRANMRLRLGDIGDYALRETAPERFTKALCYGAFHHLTNDGARHLLGTLRERFTAVGTVFVGNLPDLARMQACFPDRDGDDPDLVNPLAATGVWRSAAEIRKLAADAGWNATLTQMPADFHAAHYRFDVTLTRRA